MTEKFEKETEQLSQNPQKNTTENELLGVLDTTERDKRIKRRIEEMSEKLREGKQINTVEELISMVTELQKELKPGELDGYEQQQAEKFGIFLTDKELIRAIGIQNIVDDRMTFKKIVIIRTLWFEDILNKEIIKKITPEKLVGMSTEEILELNK